MEQLHKQMDLLQIGQSVIVETKNELLEGVIEHVNKKWSVIELSNARDMTTNYVYSSSQLLNYNQLISIKLLTADNCDNDSTPSTSTTSTATTTTATTTSTNTESAGENFVELNSVQLSLIQNQLEKKMYITQTDQKYHRALQDIKMQSVVGLCMEPIHLGRHSRTSVIAIATSRNVYIFDMYLLGKIFNEFRQIFILQRPRKVVHVSHKYFDNLYHRHEIALKGIFDTFVAHCLITGNKEPKTFEETIEQTLRIPAKYFQMTDNITPASLNCRPLSEESLLHIAKKAILQLQLYEFLLHEKMLDRFYEQCENFSRTLVENEDDFDAAQQLHSSSRAGYNRIEVDGNWKDTLHLHT